MIHWKIIALMTVFCGCHSQTTLPTIAECQPTIVNLSTILPAANIDYSSLTVSGFSSGAVMAVQLHFAYSSEVKGAGSFAGIPYGTFYTGGPTGLPLNGLLRFLTTIPFQKLPQTAPANSVLEAQAAAFAANGSIDPLSNLVGSKVYAFQGSSDTLVDPVYGQNLVNMYNDYGAITKFKQMSATHTVPTNNFPLPFVYDCTLFNLAADGINNCLYEGIFDMFSHLYGANYVAPVSSSAGYTGTYYAFNQAGYTATPGINPLTDFMDNTGYLYVPAYCKISGNTCKIHVALHGCFQSIYSLFCNLFATRTGYFQVADLNNVVIVFPQAAKLWTNLAGESNNACWDFSGQTEQKYCLKTGRQLESVRKIARAVALHAAVDNLLQQKRNCDQFVTSNKRFAESPNFIKDNIL